MRFSSVPAPMATFKATLNVDISKLKAFYRMVDGGCRSVA